MTPLIEVGFSPPYYREYPSALAKNYRPKCPTIICKIKVI